MGSPVCPVHNLRELRELEGSETLPPGLELVFIFRENQVGHLGLGPSVLGVRTLFNFPGGQWFLFKVWGSRGLGQVPRPRSPALHALS